MIIATKDCEHRFRKGLEINYKDGEKRVLYTCPRCGKTKVKSGHLIKRLSG